MLAAEGGDLKTFSAALCRGLIEALDKHEAWLDTDLVFRGFMPRPH